jgi:hypothetical protein
MAAPTLSVKILVRVKNLGGSEGDCTITGDPAARAMEVLKLKAKIRAKANFPVLIDFSCLNFAGLGRLSPGGMVLGLDSERTCGPERS